MIRAVQNIVRAVDIDTFAIYKIYFSRKPGRKDRLASGIIFNLRVIPQGAATRKVPREGGTDQNIRRKIWGF